MKPKIRVRDLELFYGQNQALKGIDMDILPNTVTAFIGPSGCGKSTFLKTLNRMNDLVDGVKITGSVELDGENIYAPNVDTTVLRRRVGIVFQEAGLLAAREKLYESADSSGVTIRIRGAEPANGAADLMYAAMQVCLNNAIQYAQATELMANIWEDGDRYTVLIRNNGRPPEKTITEGGGLSNLRRRIERIGGTMTVQSLPEFALVIGIPNRENLEEGNEWLSETY